MRISSNSSFSRPLLVAILAVAAILAITFLDQRVDSSRTAQLALSRLSVTVQDLEAAPFSADPAFNSRADARSPDLRAIVRREIAADEAKIADVLSNAQRQGAPTSTVAAGRHDMGEVRTAVRRVYVLASGPGGLAKAGAPAIAAAQRDLVLPLSDVDSVLKELARSDQTTANQARAEAVAGTILTVLLLLAVFGVFYFRSQRLARENNALLGLSREAASTDELTGLGNRRSLTEDLHREVLHEDPNEQELLVAIYDLDGFKQYNDTFGHPAGDALLVRLGARLSASVAGSGLAYRMGGDEFCVLARCSPDEAETLINNTLAALSDSGEGWQISCSQGAVWVPSEAATPKQALKCADVRMYANKSGRSSTGRQVADALLQVLNEQDADMNTHGTHVADLAADVAVALHQPDLEVQRIRLAATLHDIGKTAIPASMLNKPGPLDADEWRFMQTHTQVGERIVLAAPALADTAPLIRSSHERVDGTGYPDALAGDDIPLGSRIIAVCDTYDAITSDRAYRAASTRDAAIQELNRCSGTHFDANVVDALCKTILMKPDTSSPARLATVTFRSDLHLSKVYDATTSVAH
jgi:diguanylate cyclase (GGDEF)-like protein